MMYRLIRSVLEARAGVRKEADDLIAAYGDRSWSVARARAFEALDDQGRCDRAWNVVYRIERRLRIYRQPDTATRYLEEQRRPRVGSGRSTW